MTQPIRKGCIFLVFYFAGRTLSICPSPYLDLCGTKGNMYNVTETGTLFQDDICDCQQVSFCFLMELSQECNSTVFKFDTHLNIISSSQVICNILPLDLQGKSLSHEILNETGNELVIKIAIESDFGRYKVACDAFDISDENISPVFMQWDIVNINPTKVLVDSESKLRLTIVEQPEISSSPAWCFIRTPDGSIEIFSTSWISDTQVDCIGFSPGISGLFTVSLSSSFTPNIFDKSVSVKVAARRPVACMAQYNYDFQSLYIYFNENIKLFSTCQKVFAEDSQYYFGVGFTCFTKANILVIRMGTQFQIVSNITLNVNNKICQIGCQDAQLCLPALPINLSILKPKLPDFNFSLHLNSMCTVNATQKYVNVKFTPSKPFNFTVPNASMLKISGKNQRKNLMFWRLLRKVQNKLSSNFVLQMNTTDFEPLFKSLSLFDNVLNVNDDDLGSKASVSVFVQSSPATTSVLAEANFTFCQGPLPLFRLKWSINGEYVFEDGKLLFLKNLVPGKYIIKCMIVSYNSTEIFGQGWTTTEILANDEQVLVVPMEMTVGAADDIFFRAVTWLGTSVSWTCRLNLGEPCLTTDKKLIGSVIDLNSPNVSIPAGTLPVGSYIWTVENVKGSNKANILVKDGNVTTIGVEIPSVFVKPSQEVVLNGTVGRVQGECRAWWSSVRRKGFNYFNLNNVGVGGHIFVNEQFPAKEIPLAIPFSLENREGEDSNSFYLFELQVFCPSTSRNEKGSFDYVKVPLVVSDSPRVSPLTAEPLTGKAMITEFAISGGEAQASFEDYPLTYEWSYIDPCDFEVPIKRGAFARNFTTYLPPGDLKLIVRACGGKKTCSMSSTPTVSVIQDSEFPAENFRKAREEIQYLMASGEILEAFGLAVTVFKSLAVLAEPEIREEIFSTVEEGIKAKIKDFTNRTLSDRKNMNLCFEFIDRAVAVVKYFRKGSDILNHLLEFKASILAKNNLAN